MGRVVVLGSINSDLVVRAPRLPRPGETVLGGQFAVYGGGKGANQAIAAARAGSAVIMVGCLGDDTFGAQRLADLEREGIDTSAVHQLEGCSSGVALIGVDANGQNSIIVASGANHRMDIAMAAHLPVQPGDVLLCQLELPLPVITEGLQASQRAGALTILNAAPMNRAVSAILPLVDVLVVNELEAADLLGVPTIDPGADALGRLAELGPRQVVVTLGEHGAILWDRSTVHSVPSLAVRAVDTTGAGDAFCGVLAAGLSAGLDLVTAARHGAVAGGLSVTRAGAQTSMPFQREIEAALMQRRQHT